MKTTTCIIGILIALSLATAQGEDKKTKLSATSQAAAAEAVPGDSLLAGWREKQASQFFSERPADRIVSKRFVLSGPLVALVKSDNPLQTFNPFAVANSDRYSEPFRRDPYLPPLRGFMLFRLEF
jgi:hypothetical protein